MRKPWPAAGSCAVKNIIYIYIYIFIYLYDVHARLCKILHSEMFYYISNRQVHVKNDKLGFHFQSQSNELPIESQTQTENFRVKLLFSMFSSLALLNFLFTDCASAGT